MGDLLHVSGFGLWPAGLRPRVRLARYCLEPARLSCTGNRPIRCIFSVPSVTTPNIQRLHSRLYQRHHHRAMQETGRQKITFAEMRAAGVRGLLIYCSDFRCSHWTAISGDRWPDDLRLSDLEHRFACRACGRKGADVRPNFHWEDQARRAKVDHAPCDRELVG